MAAKATHGAFLDGDQRLVVAGQLQDQIAVQRLGKAGIGDGAGDAARGQRLGGAQHLGQAGAEGQQRNPGALAHQPPPADRQRRAAFGHLDAHTLAARITESRGAFVIGRGRGDHMHQIGLIGGGHHHHAGQIGQKGHIETASMGRPIRAHQSGAVDGKAHRKPLDRHVMHHLVVAALQKRRIHCAERLQPARRQSGAESDGVLFGNAHVKAAARKTLGKQVQASAIRHGRRHGDDLVAARRLVDQRIGKDAGIAGRVGLGLDLHPGQHVELRRGMALVGGGLGRGIALALFRQHMDQHRPGGPCLHRAQHRQQLVQIMPVDRAHIGKAQLFKQRAAHGNAFQHLLGAARTFLKRLGQQAQRAFGSRFQILKRRFSIQPREIGRQRPHRRGNRHLVVVQDHEQPFFQMAGVVQRLEGHAGRHRAVADHRDPVARIAAQIGGHLEAQRRRDRGRAMRRAEGVKGALGAFGEARQPALLPQGADAVAPPGQDLVGIALVAHVPDQLVAWRVEDRMDRHRQFDHAQTRAQMAASFRDGADRLGPQLVGQLPQLAVRQPLEVGRQMHAVQKRRLRSVGHLAPPRGCQFCREIAKRAASIKAADLGP